MEWLKKTAYYGLQSGRQCPDRGGTGHKPEKRPAQQVRATNEESYARGKEDDPPQPPPRLQLRCYDLIGCLPRGGGPTVMLRSDWLWNDFMICICILGIKRPECVPVPFYFKSISRSIFTKAHNDYMKTGSRSQGCTAGCQKDVHPQ